MYRKPFFVPEIHREGLAYAYNALPPQVRLEEKHLTKTHAKINDK